MTKSTSSRYADNKSYVSYEYTPRFISVCLVNEILPAAIAHARTTPIIDLIEKSDYFLPLF